MDVVHTTRGTSSAGIPDQSAISGKSDQSIQSTVNLSTSHANINGGDSTAAKCPKTKNLNNTENFPVAFSSTNSSGRTKSNGKNRMSNYIPPVKSRDHNTRSKNGISKEMKSVSKTSSVS